MAKWWSFALIRDIKDPRKHIISSSLAVVIADKYPKAKHHYLILPWAEIDNIFELETKHLPLLDEMYLLAKKLLEKNSLNEKKFQIGFHANPSMHRLHLHVISKDFISNSMKTKKHWISFNTELFVHYQNLYKEIKDKGYFPKFDQERIIKLLATPLLCKKCSLLLSNFQHLKFHLQEHEILDDSDDDQ